MENTIENGIAVNIDNSNVTVYPAELEYDKLLVVGASTINDTKLDGTNWGGQSVDLFAPGDHILSCYSSERCDWFLHFLEEEYEFHHSDYYHYMYGTSMATPYVTGVAALILARYPNLSATQIKTRITESVDLVPALSGLCVTGGAFECLQSSASTQHGIC